jgi:hypothetical protein
MKKVERIAKEIEDERDEPMSLASRKRREKEKVEREKRCLPAYNVSLWMLFCCLVTY